MYYSAGRACNAREQRKRVISYLKSFLFPPEGLYRTRTRFVSAGAIQRALITRYYFLAEYPIYINCPPSFISLTKERKRRKERGRMGIMKICCNFSSNEQNWFPSVRPSVLRKNRLVHPLNLSEKERRTQYFQRGIGKSGRTSERETNAWPDTLSQPGLLFLIGKENLRLRLNATSLQTRNSV